MGWFNSEQESLLGLNITGTVVMVFLVMMIVMLLLFVGMGWFCAKPKPKGAKGKPAALDSINSENMNQIEHMSDKDSSVNNTDENKKEM